MSISDIELNHILSDFYKLAKKFELSYEKLAHKKVYNSHIILAIPEGKKYLAWFTNYKEDNVCFLLEIKDNRIINAKIAVTSFEDNLVLGTIFYGTLFNYNGINCFSIEDLYYYKGQNYISKTYLEKINLLKKIFTNELSQNVLFKQYTVFGLPLMSTDFNILLKEIESLPYKVSQIKFRFFEKNNARKILFLKYFKPGANKCYNEVKNNSILSNAIFKITPDIEPDIYNLFIYKNGKEEYYDFAFIPDYKTSVMMNKLFRKIKENDNLDSIEESDDEAEFEDQREDKYVFLDKSYKMNCIYNSKFKRWVPINLALINDRIITYKQIINQKM
jgi:hypothetical protein